MSGVLLYENRPQPARTICRYGSCRHRIFPLGHAVESPELEATGSLKNDYQPIDWGHIKRVLAEDAAALADALSIAHQLLTEGTVAIEEGHRPAVLISNMTPEEFKKNNSGITVTFLEDFIEFLRMGTFEFTYDD